MSGWSWITELFSNIIRKLFDCIFFTCCKVHLYILLILMWVCRRGAGTVKVIGGISSGMKWLFSHFWTIGVPELQEPCWCIVTEDWKRQSVRRETLGITVQCIHGRVEAMAGRRPSRCISIPNRIAGYLTILICSGMWIMPSFITYLNISKLPMT